MAEFYFPKTSERAEQIFAGQPDLLAQYQQLSNRTDNMLLPHQPYLMSCSPGDELTLQALHRFSHPELQRLQQIAAEYDDSTLAIAYVTEEQINPVIKLLDEYGTTAAGAMLAAANSKYSAFQRSIVRYQLALLDLHDASQAKAQASGARTRGAHNSIITAKEAHAKRMHADMVQRFQTQLQRYQANLKSSANRSALLNVERGINVARSSRNNQRTGQTLRFANNQQVATVQRLVNVTQIVGRGVLVLDFGLRTNKVSTAYRTGGDASRMAVTQYSGFAANAATGAAVAAATKTIGIALVLGPVGWVVLIGAAIVIGLTAATLADHGVQKMTGYGYDALSGYVRGRR
ncbi:hypothetical protein ORJ04_00380 [Rheinheimera baltica]|uniref:Uncharacterized protein n=1 Tax=Rheinheimera baltica TaxID=67576 RepID=A0ABT9HTS3_9GAMM|nr:hypothetical protein [Rheinheimera baltica]MDP5134403.1 hypothetical protein [Rheinheimera baltica]